MILREWQIQRPPRQNSRPFHAFYLEPNMFWNTNWNESEMKYFIPFTRHPLENAQEKLSSI